MITAAQMAIMQPDLTHEQFCTAATQLAKWHRYCRNPQPLTADLLQDLRTGKLGKNLLNGIFTREQESKEQAAAHSEPTLARASLQPVPHCATSRNVTNAPECARVL